MRAFEAPPGAPGDVVLVLEPEELDEVERIAAKADVVVDANLEKGRLHLIFNTSEEPIAVTIVVRHPGEGTLDAVERACGVPSVIEISLDEVLEEVS